MEKRMFTKKKIRSLLGVGLIVLMTAGCGTRIEENASYVYKEKFEEESVVASVPRASEPEEGDKASVSQAAEQEQDEDFVRPTVSLIMVGDILLHDPVEASALRSDGSYDFTAVFANVREEIQAADLKLVNQEVIIGGTELGISGYPAFNAPYEIGDALADAGFNLVCHATNHALDKGKRGVGNCLKFWQENHPEIGVLGIHDSQESQDTIYVYEKDGIKIAVLNYTYGTNGIALPQDMPFAVDLLEKNRVEEDLQKAEEIADFTVVCPHWGTEYALGVSAAQKEWTRVFLENGADLVLGTHPHVIEPIEWVTDEELGLEMLVYYSLGNFVNWTSGTGEGVANRMVGGMAQVTLERAEDGRVLIADYGVMPLVCHVEEGTDGVTVYALSDYTEELAERNAIIQQDSAFSLAYCRELCDRVWDEEFVH
ncbi:MAG: CapA family protein [Bacteroidales bacterium]|nr:CapA family protein [Lachnoclostridium sp.]MCM1383735.1 CapA family protein [Lachnoclostridium sp.]MCM1464363.1 CapA family protein [Bacteroidales bacterium]